MNQNAQIDHLEQELEKLEKEKAEADAPGGQIDSSNVPWRRDKQISALKAQIQGLKEKQKAGVVKVRLNIICGDFLWVDERSVCES